ncbi:hypothetical protein HN51_047951 [Arachis hypogaea]
MAKNGATLVIATLMILVIICSGAIDEFHETIPEEDWTTSYYIANHSLEICAKNCLIRHKNKLKEQKECVKKCIFHKCSQLYPTNEKKQNLHPTEHSGTTHNPNEEANDETFSARECLVLQGNQGEAGLLAGSK